jgi:UDP-4-amino-4,6-dideoxy-L-N-acetyl-beta-L-altrosamine transaminase
MIPYGKQSIYQDDIDAVVSVLQSDYLTQGPVVEQFEKALCSYTGAKYALVFNSGTSALHAAYLSVGLKNDDEVITSPISFVATSNMIIQANAKPIFVDVKLDGNIDEKQIEKAITSKTKAIVPVHFSGNICNMDSIIKLAKKYNLFVIEDSAHAFGSHIGKKYAGTFGDIGIFSFHAIKPITTGEGGALITDNKELYERAKKTRSHGITKKEFWNFDMIDMGFNYRLSDINCALGLSQLSKINDFIQKRQSIAQQYNKAFQNNSCFYSPVVKKEIHSSYHLYTINLKPELYCQKEDIFNALRKKGLGVQVHYKPIYKNSFYEKKYGSQFLFVSEEFYKGAISLPCHQNMNNDDIQYVISTLLEVLEAYQFRCRSF